MDGFHLYSCSYCGAAWRCTDPQKNLWEAVPDVVTVPRKKRSSFVSLGVTIGIAIVVFVVFLCFAMLSTV